jgi:hypothetical protein
MPFLPLLAFCLLCWFCCSAGAAPEGSPPPTRIWSGLVLATNPAHPGQSSERLRKYSEKLKHIFGYNQFDLIGEYSDKVDDRNERWLVPSKEFYMSVHPETGKRVPMKRIVLFEGRRRVAEFDTRLTPESPLFIRGPQYAGGQLVIVVHAGDVPEVTPPPRAAAAVMVAAPGAGPETTAPKMRPPAGTVMIIPKEPFYPSPAERLQMPADRAGSFDLRSGRP